MSISSPSEPPGGRVLVAAALASRAAQMPAAAVPLQCAAPLPVYVIEAGAAAGPAPLGAAVRAGWRYPVLDAEGALLGLAFLRETDGRLVYAGLSHGALSDRFLAAANLAETALGASPQAYEPRLLEVPALRLCVLWMAGEGGEDRFVPVLDGTLVAEAAMAIETDISPRIAAARGRAPAGPPVASVAGGGVRVPYLRVVGPVLAGLLVAVPLAPLAVPWFASGPFRVWAVELALVVATVMALGAACNGAWFGILVDGRNRISLSRLQIVAWTVLFAATFAAVLVWNGTMASTVGLDVPEAAWLLMAMSGISAAGTPLILSAKPDPGAAAAPPNPRDGAKYLDGVVVKRRAGLRASWWDILLGDEAGNADAIDIGKVQQLLLSGAAWLAYAAAVGHLLWATAAHAPVSALPAMPGSFLALIGASHATYLAYKAASHSN